MLTGPPLALVVLDVDGTLCPHVSSWQYLHDELGLWSGNAERHWEEYRSGAIDYAEFCDRDAAHWRGLPLAKVQGIMDAVPYNPGVPTGLRRLRELGLKVALLSTGLTILTDRIQREFALDRSLANELVSRDGVLTGRVDVRVEDGGKGEGLQLLAEQTGIPVEQMVGVGDGGNDRDVARRVGRFVAHRCHDAELARLATFDNNVDDFGAVVSIIERWCGTADSTGPARG